MIGAASVGKTALVYRYVLDELPPSLTSTIGVEFTKRSVIDPSTNSRILLHIFDTAGQERFKSVTKHYYRGADACLLVYDISSRESFEEVPNWLVELKENTPSECLVALIGNKCDLESSGTRSVSRKEAETFATKHKLFYQETSAFWERDRPFSAEGLQGGIEHIFMNMIRKLIARHSYKEDLQMISEADSKPVKLDLSQLYNYHTNSQCSC